MNKQASEKILGILYAYFVTYFGSFLVEGVDRFTSSAILELLLVKLGVCEKIKAIFR